MPILREPIPRELHRWLRGIVLATRVEHGRRQVPPGLYVGWPSSARPAAAGGDALREARAAGVELDLVRALLLTVRTEPPPGPPVDPIAWLTRAGPLAWCDLDALWLGPVLRAFAEVDLSATFVTVTKTGWYDPRSGARREWKRLRPGR